MKVTPQPDSPTPQPDSPIRKRVSLSRKQRLFAFLDDPSYSRGAFYYSFLVQCASMYSCFLLIIRTSDGPIHGGFEPRFPNLPDYDWFWYNDAVLTALFSLEFILRILTCPCVFFESENTADIPFVRFWFNWADLVSVLPFFSDWLFGNLSFISLLRLSRMLRILKIMKNFKGAGIFKTAIAESLQPLKLAFMFLSILVCVNGAVLYLIDPCINKLHCPFPDVFTGVYFSLVTICTVGYGDIVPSADNIAARVLSLLLMVIGTLFLAMPIEIIGSSFNSAYMTYSETQKEGTLPMAWYTGFVIPFPIILQNGAPQFDIPKESIVKSKPLIKARTDITKIFQRPATIHMQMLRMASKTQVQLQTFLNKRTLENNTEGSVINMEILMSNCDSFLAKAKTLIGKQDTLRIEIDTVVELPIGEKIIAASQPDVLDWWSRIRKMVGTNNAMKLEVLKAVSAATIPDVNMPVVNEDKEMEIETPQEQEGDWWSRIRNKVGVKSPSTDTNFKKQVAKAVHASPTFSRTARKRVAGSIMNRISRRVSSTTGAFQNILTSSKSTSIILDRRETRIAMHIEKYHKKYTMQDVHAADRSGSLRDAVWLLMEVPPSSKTSYTIEKVLRWSLIFSIFVMLGETMPEFARYGENTHFCKNVYEYHCTPLYSHSNRTAAVLENPGCFVHPDSSGPDEILLDCTEDTNKDDLYRCYGAGKNFGSEDNPEGYSCYEHPSIFSDDAVCNRHQCERVHTFYLDMTFVWVYIEWYFTILFTLEQAAHFYSFKKKSDFFKDPILWIDIVSLGAFYSEVLNSFVSGIVPIMAIAPGSTDVLTMVRLCRIGRIFKLYRNMPGTHILEQCIVEVAHKLKVPYFMLTISVIMFSFMLYEVERGTECFYGTPCTMPDDMEFTFPDELIGTKDDKRILFNQNGDLTQFPDFFSSMWFVMAAITSVGYGDVNPVSQVGRFTTIICILFGACYTAMPLTMMGKTFFNGFVRGQNQALRLRIEGLSSTKILLDPSMTLNWQEFATTCAVTDIEKKCIDLVGFIKLHKMKLYKASHRNSISEHLIELIRQYEEIQVMLLRLTGVVQHIRQEGAKLTRKIHMVTAEAHTG